MKSLDAVKSLDALQKKYDTARDELIAAVASRLKKIQRMDGSAAPVVKRKRGRPPGSKNKKKR